MFKKIRAKFMGIFLSMVVFLGAITGGVAYYNQTALLKNMRTIDSIYGELEKIRSLQLALDMMLMPGNDYIITGRAKYRDNFEKASVDADELLIWLEDLLAGEDESGHPDIKVERAIVKDVRIAWQNIRRVSYAIFKIPNPVGSKDAGVLMEEMDYAWSYPAIKKLKRWEDIENKEFSEAKEESSWLRKKAWIIIGFTAALLSAISIVFAFFLARLFVHPIEEMHRKADAIAKGIFKGKIYVNSKDELGQLAESINHMSVQLDSLYTNMEGVLDERTKELQERIQELERFSRATSQREFRIKELKERVADLEKDSGAEEGGSSS